ncbi:MAG: protein phosphatase 2C domain-containing protein [Candidatus Micrarchaeota archaeon]
MEELIRGTEVETSKTFSGANGFSSFFGVVKKGHSECGDSAFAYSDKDKAVVAVFDGVSGEGGAANASSRAAEAILRSLKPLKKVAESDVKKALKAARDGVDFGYTTAIVLCLRKDGTFIVAGVGDSPAYGMGRDGKASLLLPLARIVGDGDSILKFFHYRNIVSSVIGRTDSEIQVAMRSGKLESGESIIIASDGLSDNLYVKTAEGYVKDSSGADDIGEIAGGETGPEAAVSALLAEVGRRISVGKVERRGSLLVPKEDDVAIAAIQKL